MTGPLLQGDKMNRMTTSKAMPVFEELLESPQIIGALGAAVFLRRKGLSS